MTEKSEEQTTIERIIQLLMKGYTRSQLIHDFNFPERTVDAGIKRYKELHGDPNTKQTKGNGEIKAETLPAKAKTGEGIIPEFIAAEMVNIFDGNERDQRIFMAGMSVPLMGLRLFVEGVKPLIELLTTWQKGQAEAAAAAQGSSMEIAREAAAGVAEAISPAFESLKASIAATAPNPVQAMIVNSIQPFFQQAIGSLMRFISQRQAPKQQSSPPGVQPGQGDYHAPHNGQLGSQPVPGFKRVTKEEIEEAFKDV